MSLINLFRRWFHRRPRTISWTIEELYERTLMLSDDMLKDLGSEHIKVISTMLELLPASHPDRELLEQLRKQLVLPSARLCTIATVECERIKHTGIFDEWIAQQASHNSQKQ